MNKLIAYFTGANNQATRLVRFNWAGVLAFAVFWTYGYFGAISDKKISAIGLITFAILVGIFAGFLWLFYYRRDRFSASFTYTVNDKRVFLLFLGVMILASIPELTQSINGDQLYHAQVSMYHSIYVGYMVKKFLPRAGDMHFTIVMYVINLALLIGGLLFIYVVSKFKPLVRIALFVGAFAVLRFAIMSFGGSSDAHPAFRLFPMWLSATILTPHSFAFRLPQLAGLAALMFITYRFALRYFTPLKSILFGFAIGTIPVLWHSGILAEQSIWSALVISYVLFEVIHKAMDRNHTLHLFQLSAIVAVGVLMRQPIVATVFVLLALNVAAVVRKQIAVKDLVFNLLPIIVCIPFLLKSILMGTPATNAADNSSGLTEGLAYSLTSGIGLYSVLNNMLYWVIFLPFVLICFKWNKLIALLLLAFAGVLYIEFYSIRQVLWGVGRYQIEYVIPFVILGFFFFTYVLLRRQQLFIAFALLLVAANVVVFRKFGDYNESLDKLKYTYFDDIKKPFRCIILSESIFPTGEALKKVKEDGYAKNVYLHGVVYGVLPEIMTGYTVNEAETFHKQFKALSSLPDQEFVTQLDQAKDIKIALFSSLPDSSIIGALKTKGWGDWKTFYDARNRSTVVGLIRGN